MQKIPTLFKREFPNKHIVTLDEVTPGFEWVLNGEGVATIKFDGSCIGKVDGVWCKRYDCKKGRKPPENGIACCDPDPVTGHWPFWVPIDESKPEDKWYVEAIRFAMETPLQHGIERDENGHTVETYEAVGRHFNGNPYDMDFDTIVPHGRTLVDVERSYEGIKEYLQRYNIEGIVFWKDGQPQCKIKRKDFGIKWPTKTNSDNLSVNDENSLLSSEVRHKRKDFGIKWPIRNEKADSKEESLESILRKAMK